MNIENRLIFVARPGGKTDTMARKFMADRVTAAQARCAYAKSKGSRATYGTEGGVYGLVFPADKLPAGWRSSKKKCADDPADVVAIPNLKDKLLGRALKAELTALPSLPDGWTFNNLLGFGGMFSGMKIFFANCMPLGEKIIVTVPRYDRVEKDGELPVEDMNGNSKQFVPEDCDQIKASEYFALVEAAEEAAKK